MQAGSFYKQSGRFDVPRAIVLALVGAILGGFIGFIYSGISSVNPLLYLNFLLLGGTIYLLMKISGLISIYNFSRNAVVNICTSVIICFVAWYVNWVTLYASQGYDFFASFFSIKDVMLFVLSYIGDHEIVVGRLGWRVGLPLNSGLLALVYCLELLAFSLPVFVSKQVNYFCEDCQKHYKKKQLFIRSATRFMVNLRKSTAGFYDFIGEMQWTTSKKFYKRDANSNLIIVDYHFCDKCNKNSIIDISEANLKIDKFDIVNIEDERMLVQGVYIDDKTDFIIQNNVQGAEEETQNTSFETEYSPTNVSRSESDTEITENKSITDKIEIDDETKEKILALSKTDAITFCREQYNLSIKDAKTLINELTTK